jgi:hypothetical protein
MPLKLTGPAQPVVRDQPQTKYTDENRPIGAKSILGGRQVVWAGPDWRWQSPKSFGKLKGSGKLNRSIFSDPLGVIGNELRYIGRQVQATNRGGGGGVVGAAARTSLSLATRNPAMGALGLLPLGGQTGRNIQAGLVVGAAENAAKLGIAVTQKVRGRSANPESARPNSMVERISETGYRALGATPPGQQNQFERGVDAIARSTGTAIGGTALATKAIPAIGAGAAGAVVTGGLRWAAGELLSTLADDNRGGNPVNIAEALTGRQLPLSVNVGEDDWIDSGLKSLIPNAIPGLALGGVGEAAGGFRNTRRWLKDRRTVSQVTDARTQLQQAGVTQTDPATGATAFKPTEPDPTGQQARINQFFEDIGETDQPQTVFGSLRGDQPATPARPPADAADAAPTTEAAPAPKADAEPAAAPAAGGELEVEGVEIDPFELIYDPELPEADVVFNLVRDLDDTDLQALLAQPGPVVPRIDELLAAREAIPVRPELKQGRVMAPAESVAERIGPDGQPLPYEQTLEAMPMETLRGAAAPENNPALAQLIGDITGREFEEFTKADIIEGLAKYREQSGQALLVRDWQQSFRPTGEIQADPLRFQYKQGVNEAGEQRGNSLDGVDRWDTVAEGTLDVWTDPANNTTYVVNGHNRLARANQLGIPTLPTRELPAATAEEARALGALANIKEGRGTVFDAAKFMRDTGITSPEQLQRMGAPMTDGHAARGLALSQLPDNIFQAAVDGRLSVGKAAALGGSGLDEAQMQAAMKILGDRDLSDSAFNEVVQQVRSAPVVKQSDGAQTTLLELMGMSEEALSLAVEKGKLAAKIRADLISDKNLFGKVGKKAERLQQAGNKISVEGSAMEATDARAVLGIFDAVKYAPGAVSSILDDGAKQIADGAKPGVVANRIRDQIVDAVRQSAEEQGLPAARAKTENPGLDAFADEMRQARASLKEEMAAGEEEMAVVAYGPLDFEFWGDSPVEVHLRRFDDLEGDRLAQTGATQERAASMSPRQKAMLLKNSFDQARTVLEPGRYILNSEVPATRKMLARLYRDDPDFDWFSRDTDAPSVPSGDSYPVLTVREQGLPTARPAAAAAEPAEAAPQAVELTPEQRQAAQIEVIRRAVDEAEVRPPETPIPELPDGPALTPDLARADLETRGGQVEPGTPAAQAVADEIRLTAEFAERDAQMRAIAEEGAKDAMGYELKTFEEKKALGAADGYDLLPEPEARPLAEGEVAPAPVRPEPLQLADGPPIELDTRGKGEFFHGAASEFELERGAEFGGDGMNIYGDGLYVTDDIKTAAGYRKKNAGRAKTGGVVYRITELSPVKLYDLDKPLTKTDVKRLRSSLSTRGRELFDEAIEQFEKLPPLAEVMDEMRASSRSFDMPAHEVQEEFFGMQEALEKQGYGGYTHQGGNLAGKGKRLHQVRIYWDPAEKLAIEKVDPMMAEPRTKTADQATRQQIQANEQRMAELRRKMQDEGCSL